MRTIEARNVTTSGEIGGWEITDYAGPVVAHSVSGAGLATEFLAGFSDVFGGRSHSIRDRLSEIHRDALEQLRVKGGALGANWIIGLRVDTGEISGKNTMMFMVTVSGTAVTAQKTSAWTNDASSGSHKQVTVTQVVEEDSRLRLTELSDPDDLDREEVFRDVVAHRVECLAPLVLSWVREAREGVAQPTRDVRIERAMAFFANLDRDVASAAVYAEVVVPSVPESLFEQTILESLNLMSLERTACLLESDSRESRWWGLQTLVARQAAYSESDLLLVDRCVRAIKARPASDAELITVKKLVGSKVVWHCLAGHENVERWTTCECGLGRGGFRVNDVTPDKALSALARLRRALESCLGGNGARV